ncbi:M48 family metallopeptidase [Alteromonas sp. 5E99-2]|uniref:beta-barrel assembly-enhancing protease n=1 Tax=Alteromonas sp. 5E99-2 TaxID=2817683 RepID=UPI001A999C54|nr:M48 family metalloprotease [Alteromonas sp. 5E99-2]MBO1255564.1 M48 family metallopeptidase [Alteromonas sp. 5E99-2]
MSQTSDKNALPDIGVVASDAITLDKEVIIGDALMRQLRGQSPIVQDPVLQQYIQDLGNRLVLHANNTNFPFEFFIINNNAINAFAFFGGHVGMHTGLIARADSESEIASVLAHEIAHVTQRHIARRIQAQSRTSPLAIASLIGGILLAIADPQAGIAAIQASSAAQAQFGINYTRSNEQEADRVGISLLSRAGFDPRGADSFFSKLAAASRLVSKPPERLLTHPLTENRIADARARLVSLPKRNLPPSLSFHLAKTRILARYSFNEDYSLDYFENAYTKGSGIYNEAARYGYAMALLRNDKAKQAQPIIAALLKRRPNNHFYLDTMTDVLLAQEKSQDAIKLLNSKYRQSSSNVVIALNLANAYLNAGNNKQAIQVLRDYLLLDKDNYLAYQLLADAYQENGNKGLMHQSNAEFFALIGGYERAIDELQFAYNFSKNDHLTKQKIRARIQQLRNKVKSLQSL